MPTGGGSAGKATGWPEKWVSVAEECWTCHAPIWRAYSMPAEGEEEKSVPVNDPAVLCGGPGFNCVHPGNIAVWRDSHGVLRYRYLKKDDKLREAEHRAVSHFATCPQAGQWRRKRKKTATP